jgi:hypothetical protein
VRPATRWSKPIHSRHRGPSYSSDTRSRSMPPQRSASPRPFESKRDRNLLFGAAARFASCGPPGVPQPARVGRPGAAAARGWPPPSSGEYPADRSGLSRAKGWRPGSLPEAPGEPAASGRQWLATYAAPRPGAGRWATGPVAGDVATGTPPAGGLWARAGQRAMWARIFSITSGCSMNARMRIAPPQRGQTSGPPLYILPRWRYRTLRHACNYFITEIGWCLLPCAASRPLRI